MANKRQEIESVLEFFILSKEREHKHIPSHEDLKKQLFDNNQQTNFINRNLSLAPSNLGNKQMNPNLYSLDQLPSLNEENNHRISEQLNLNLSKLNENSQKNNIRIIRQTEHKLNRQKEVNRDLRVEKDMYMMKLQEAEKRLNDLIIG